MTLETAGAVVLVVSAVSGIVFTIYKLRPESTKIFVDSATMSVKLADAGRDQLAAELAEERAERAAEKATHDEYRKMAGTHMAEQSAQIRGLKAELKHCRKELELERQGKRGQS